MTATGASLAGHATRLAVLPFTNLGDSAGALVSYRKSVEILESLTRKGATNIDYLKNLRDAGHQTALLLVRLQRWKEAQEMGQKVLDISLRLVDLDPNNQEYRILLVRSYHVKGETVEELAGLARWLETTPERFGLTLEDLAALPAAPPVVATSP